MIITDYHDDLWPVMPSSVSHLYFYLNYLYPCLSTPFVCQHWLSWPTWNHPIPYHQQKDGTNNLHQHLMIITDYRGDLWPVMPTSVSHLYFYLNYLYPCLSTPVIFVCQHWLSWPLWNHPISDHQQNGGTNNLHQHPMITLADLW